MAGIENQPDRAPPLQFGLARLFVLTAGAAIVAWLPKVVALFVLLALAYVACASGWIVDLAVALGRRIIKNR